MDPTYGVRLDDPAAIGDTLCGLSQECDVPRLKELLKIPEVLREINRGDREYPTWPALGRAFGTNRYLNKNHEKVLDFCLTLLRHGANPLANSGSGDVPILDYIVDTQSASAQIRRNSSYTIYQNDAPSVDEALFHAVIANRLLQNDIGTVSRLLETACSIAHHFNASKLLAEIKLHHQESTLGNRNLQRALEHITACATINDISKEIFADFCKQKSGLSLLDNEKPEKKDLPLVLQEICSLLLMSPYKRDLLDALGLDDTPGLGVIHTVTDAFHDNFAAVFKKLFIDNPGEAEAFILANSVREAFLQIYHYYAHETWHEQLETILVNVTETLSKEPVAAGILPRIAALEQENGTLRQKLEDLLPAIVALQKNNAELRQKLETCEKAIKEQGSANEQASSIKDASPQD